MLNKKGRKCPFFTPKKNVTLSFSKPYTQQIEGTSINHYFRTQRNHRTIRLLFTMQVSSKLVNFVYPSHDQRKLKHDALVTLD